jgi:hypothetical protein
MDEFHIQNLPNCCGHQYDQMILQIFLFHFSEFSSCSFFLPFGRGVRLLLFLLLGLDFLCVPTSYPKKIGTRGRMVWVRRNVRRLQQTNVIRTCRMMLFADDRRRKRQFQAKE